MTSPLPIDHRCLFLSWIVFCLFFFMFAPDVNHQRRHKWRRQQSRRKTQLTFSFAFQHFTFISNCNARSSPNQAQSERGVFYISNIFPTYMRSALFHMDHVSIWARFKGQSFRELYFAEFTDWYHQLSYYLTSSLKEQPNPNTKTHIFSLSLWGYSSRIV